MSFSTRFYLEEKFFKVLDKIKNIWYIKYEKILNGEVKANLQHKLYILILIVESNN